MTKFNLTSTGKAQKSKKALDKELEKLNGYVSLVREWQSEIEDWVYQFTDEGVRCITFSQKVSGDEDPLGDLDMEVLLHLYDELIQVRICKWGKEVFVYEDDYTKETLTIFNEDAELNAISGKGCYLIDCCE